MSMSDSCQRGHHLCRPGLLVSLAAAALLMSGCIDYFDELPARPDGGGVDAAQHDEGERNPDARPDALEVDIGMDDDDERACDDFAFRGAVYNCSELDRCTEEEFEYRLACCECSQRFCVPDPGNPCPVPDAGPEPEPEPEPPPSRRESCMACHNGANQRNDYSGLGILNPHPFPGAASIPCTGCHGGNGQGAGKGGSHVAPPPEIGDRNHQANNEKAFFNRVTLAGIDRLEPDPYPGQNGAQHSNLDYLEFINPGDLRVVSAGRGCGQPGCHFDEHAQWVPRSIMATTTGLFSSTRFLVGVGNRIPEYRGDVENSHALADSAPRAIVSPTYDGGRGAEIGEVGHLVEQPELAQFEGPMVDNEIYLAAALDDDVIRANLDPQRPNRVRNDSPLETLIDEQLNLSCGDCHLWSAGANNRYADFRSSGCTACHMEYSYDGRHRGYDPNVPRDEPADPDQIAAGERAHVQSHRIHSVAKWLPNGAFLRGITDRACLPCHRGSNRTVLQYWGVRLDQNEDLRRGFQYPGRPDDFENTAQDQRLYNPAVQNNTFHGRNADQYILSEDYDADGRDDTPPDLHYEAGLGCIDCHGSRDLHGGVEGDPTSGEIRSRQDQSTAIRCESCHGGVVSFAATGPCTTYIGEPAECALDSRGNPLRHVVKDAEGHYWLTSRVTGGRHYLPQTRDVAVPTGRTHPFTFRFLYSPKASYAMGRTDGDIRTGTGPIQTDPNLYSDNFSHLDVMDCASCHAAWTNTCIGCHLANAYNANPADYFFSNITGERILLAEEAADFVYQSPVMQYLGVNSRGRITKMLPAEKVFWRFVDFQGNSSDVFAFSDRLGEGNNPALGGRNDFPALGMNQMMPHSIRAAVTGDAEGPTYCVGCHVNVDMLNDVGLMAQYDAFVAAYDNQDFANIDFHVLRDEIGLNTGNQNNSPFFVRMMTGLGTGLFLFDEDGCPINPLDDNADRPNCNRLSPADGFADRVNEVRYDLDRLVEFNGIPNASSAHPRLRLHGAQRSGATNGTMAGPLGSTTLQRLVGGDDIRNALILDSWLDADGNAQGDAADYIQ